MYFRGETIKLYSQIPFTIINKIVKSSEFSLRFGSYIEYYSYLVVPTNVQNEYNIICIIKIES